MMGALLLLLLVRVLLFQQHLHHQLHLSSYSTPSNSGSRREMIMLKQPQPKAKRGKETRIGYGMVGQGEEEGSHATRAWEFNCM